MALNTGVTPEEIAGIMAVIKMQLGRKTAANGLEMLEKVLQTRNKK